MIGFIAAQLGKTALPEELLRPIAWAIAAVAALALAVPLLAWAKAAYDNSVIEAATNEANVEFLEELNTVTGEADLSSEERREVFERQVKTTMELIDEANERGCAVADYLSSNGHQCLPVDGSPIQSPGP